MRTDPIWTIANDRSERWATYLQEHETRQEILDWADAMTALHGPVCRFYNNTVGWVIALLITRYGEAEYHWPTEGFTTEDISRAERWQKRGEMPTGCHYV